MQVSLNGIKTQMLATNTGIKRTHSDQSYWAQHMEPNQDVMGRWYNGVAIHIPNHGRDYHSGVSSNNGDVWTM